MGVRLLGPMAVVGFVSVFQKGCHFTPPPTVWGDLVSPHGHRCLVVSLSFSHSDRCVLLCYCGLNCYFLTASAVEHCFLCPFVLRVLR